jgi:2-polyprenyl-3-methyl-5-hydroxy-6-metoxy-1,4-benzoquinol methylase
MTTFLLAVCIFGIFSTITFIVWRLSSRRSSLPCPSWLSWMVELDNPFAKSQNARSIVGRLGVKPGMTVLDAGCGPGRLTVPLAQAVGPQGEVAAVDMQSGMLERARAKAQAAGLANITWHELAIGPGTLGVERYDRAVLVTVLGEIPDRQAAISELYRVLKPGGFLSVTEIIFDPHYQRRVSVVALANAAGFREKAFYGNALAFTLHLEKPVPGMNR